MLVRTYRLGAILDSLESEPRERQAESFQPKSGQPPVIDAIVDTIMSSTSGPWFDIEDEGGTITPVANLLVVRHTLPVHEEVEAILEALTAVATKRVQATAIPIRTKTEDGSAERKAKAILSKQAEKGEVEFVEFPLDQAIAYFADLTGIEIVIDRDALEEDGIATDEPITLVVKDVTLRSALDLVCEPLGLTTIFRHGVMVLTTEIVAYDRLTTSVYTVDDILDAGGLDGDMLIDLLMTNTSGPWFLSDGEPASISFPFRPALVIRQTQKVHAEVAALLADLRLGLAKRTPAPPVDSDEVVLMAYDWTAAADDGDQLAAAIKSIVASKSWNDANDGGVIHVVGNRLVIRQTRKTHRTIRRFIAALTRRCFRSNDLFGF